MVPLWGALGAALSSLISYAIAAILAIRFMLKFTPFSMPLRSTMLTLFSSLVFFVLLIIGRKMSIGSVPKVVLVVCVAGTVYLVLLKVLRVFDPKELFQMMQKSFSKRLQ